MYRKIDDFIESWDNQREGTQKLLDALTDASLSQAVAEGHRTIARLAWHMVTSISEMGGRTGLSLDAPSFESKPPSDVTTLRGDYRRTAQSLAEQVRAHWDDDTLAIEDDMYGEQWARGRTLAILQAHEIHHRGQLTVLMRQAGIKVPGVFGPSQEEWAEYGMTDPEA